jgi:hypothetical protein
MPNDACERSHLKWISWDDDDMSEKSLTDSTENDATFGDLKREVRLPGCQIALAII